MLALILKYPFFEYGPRYAAATGRTLVEGYRRIGPWALWLYFVMTLATAVIHQLAVLLLLAFLIQFALGAVTPVWVIGGLVYVACSLLLVAGRFRGLDLTIKVIVTALAVSTLVAAAIATLLLFVAAMRLLLVVPVVRRRHATDAAADRHTWRWIEYSQLAGVGEIQLGLPARWMYLRKEHLLFRAMQGTPVPEAPL